MKCQRAGIVFRGSELGASDFEIGHLDFNVQMTVSPSLHSGVIKLVSPERRVKHFDSV